MRRGKPPPADCKIRTQGSSPRLASQRILQTACLVLLMVLGACGGDGGGGSDAEPPVNTPQGGTDSNPPTTPTTPPPPPVETPQQQAPVVTAAPPIVIPPPPPPPDPPMLCIQTADKGCLGLVEYEHEVESRKTAYSSQRNFSNQWGLSSIQAQRAYAHVELLKGTPIDPGEGVTLGFVDSGIDQTHQLFAGATINEPFLLGATNETGTRFSHGTAVASVAAAPRIVTTVNAGHSVAWGANIAMFSIPTGRGPASYNPITLTSLQARDSTWTTIINGALN